MFWPTGQHSYESEYAQAYKNLIIQRNNLYVDFLVVSEVINRVLRLEYKKANLDDSQNFKKYRDSTEGVNVLNDIYVIVKDNILKHFQIIGKSFNKGDIEIFLNVDKLDFVDKAIASICLDNNFVLLTHDKDFKDTGLDILTGNNNIFN